MANRHHHRKLRAAIRRRMDETGETYQAAHNAIVREMLCGIHERREVPEANDVRNTDDGSSQARPSPRASFLTFTFFGNPMTIAVCEATDQTIAFVVPSAARNDFARPPRSPLIGAWMLRDRARPFAKGRS